MIFAKRIDLYGQVGLVAGFLLMAFIWPFNVVPAACLGGWQLMSAFIHFFNRHHLLRNTGRYYYEIFLVTILMTGAALVILSNSFINFSTLLLWCAPLMACWYCYLTMTELRRWEARAWIRLK